MVIQYDSWPGSQIAAHWNHAKGNPVNCISPPLIGATMIGLTACLGCLPAADVVILTDGDRFTGTIQKLEKGQLTLKSKYSESPLKIDWPLVSGITTESDVNVTLQDGQVSTGRFAASSTGLNFVSSGSTTAISPASVTALELKPEGSAESASNWLRQVWSNSSVSADFDQSYSGLSNYNQLSSNTEIEYTGDRWDASLSTHYYHYGATGSGDSTYQAYGRFVAQRYIGGDHFFLFPYIFLGRQTSEDGGRGQMRQYGGGIGWTFRRQYSDQVSFYAGLVRNITTGFKAPSDEGRADVRIDNPLYVAAVSWDKKLTHKITTSVLLYYYKPILAGGHNSLATDASAKFPLFGPAYFTVRVQDTPELAQRQLFSTKNLQVSSGIGIEF